MLFMTAAAAVRALNSPAAFAIDHLPSRRATSAFFRRILHISRSRVEPKDGRTRMVHSAPEKSEKAARNCNIETLCV